MLTLFEKFIILDTIKIPRNVVDMLFEVKGSRTTFRIFPRSVIMSGSNIDFTIIRESFEKFKETTNQHKNEISFKERLTNKNGSV